MTSRSCQRELTTRPPQTAGTSPSAAIQDQVVSTKCDAALEANSYTTLATPRRSEVRNSIAQEGHMVVVSGVPHRNSGDLGGNTCQDVRQVESRRDLRSNVLR